MTIDDWFTWATADADRRGLPQLKRLLEGMRAAMGDLRDADWNQDPADQHGSAHGGGGAHGDRPSNEQPPS